jgi:signal transduction histidine kinase
VSNEIEFKKYLAESTSRYLALYVSTAIAILLWFCYSDIYIRLNINAFFTRLLPLTIGISLLLFHFLSKSRKKKTEFKWYNIFFFSGLVMMYAKYMVYLPFEGSSYSVTGIIVIIFLVALDLKVSTYQAALAFFSPLLVLSLVVIFITPIPESKYVNFTNLYPMTVLGFVSNRIMYRLRFNLFKSGYLLQEEQKITQKLYDETLATNDYLKEKNEEIEMQKEIIMKANYDLRQLNKTKNKFFSIISHDLKTPLNSIIGFSNLLSENYDQFTKAEHLQYINIIEKGADNTQKLLDNLLEWAQTQTNNDSFKPKLKNLFELTNDVISILQHTADNKHIHILNYIDADLNAEVDENKIRTVFRNLISNAIKFTQKYGKVIISGSELKTNEQNLVMISVEDDGIGIPDDKINQLFSLSEKVSSPGTQNELGTGLGLLLCSEMIKRHQGEIWVESELNKGSKFTFTIPSGLRDKNS